ncbi:MAG: AAA family ATPase [Methylococcus sp.]
MNALSLSKVGFNGFRGLRHLDLDGLGRINILVGGNNSGKTSVLEALSILCQPYNPDEWLAMIRRRDFGRLDETLIQSLRWCFAQVAGLNNPDQLIEADCEFLCLGNTILRGLNVQYAEISGEPSQSELRRALGRKQALTPTLEPMRGAELTHVLNWDESTSSDNALQKLINIAGNPSIKVWEKLHPYRSRTSTVGPGFDCETLTPYSYQINTLQVKFQSKQIFQQDSPNTLELLRDFDDDIENIDLASFRGDRPAIYIKHKKLGIAPLSIFGDAMRRAVLLAGTLLSLKDGGILLIDEVEAGIHVGALGQVFEWLAKAAQSLRVQIFVTTHSLEALDAMLAVRTKLGEDDVVVFHLDQTPEITRAKRFSGNLLHRLRFERGLDVR